MYLLSSATEALSLNPSVAIVALVFIVFHLIMSRLLYRPLMAVLREREARTEGKRAAAAKSLEECEVLLKRYESGIKAARQEGYGQMDAVRREALARQVERLAAANAESRRQVEAAVTEVDAQRSELRRSLAGEIQGFARLMSARILTGEGR
jgi:F-type H+-transporting ATPase subunit b